MGKVAVGITGKGHPCPTTSCYISLSQPQEWAPEGWHNGKAGCSRNLKPAEEEGMGGWGRTRWACQLANGTAVNNHPRGGCGYKGRLYVGWAGAKGGGQGCVAAVWGVVGRQGRQCGAMRGNGVGQWRVGPKQRRGWRVSGERQAKVTTPMECPGPTWFLLPRQWQSPVSA